MKIFLTDKDSWESVNNNEKTIALDSICKKFSGGYLFFDDSKDTIKNQLLKSAEEYNLKLNIIDLRDDSQITED